MRSVIQRKSAPSAASINARNAKRPSATRQYKLRCQRLGDISCLVTGAPDGQDDLGLGGIRLDLLAQSLDERIDAAHGHVRLVLPDAVQQGFTAEDNARARQQHGEQLKFVRREVDVAATETHAAA